MQNATYKLDFTKAELAFDKLIKILASNDIVSNEDSLKIPDHSKRAVAAQVLRECLNTGMLVYLGGSSWDTAVTNIKEKKA